jgi:hypothetical protein
MEPSFGGRFGGSARSLVVMNTVFTYLARRVVGNLPRIVGGLINVSSKTARLHRRQAANRRKYARLRKAGRVPQHTRAERRRAAAERERQREAEQGHVVWFRRGTVTTAIGVGAAATLTFSTAPATGNVFRMGRPYSVLNQAYALMRSDSPDYPHLPEQEMTYDPVFYAAGTARADIATRPVASGSWLPWEWTYSPNVLGD